MPAQRFTIDLNGAESADVDLAAAEPTAGQPTVVALPDGAVPSLPAAAGSRRERRKKARQHGTAADERLAARQRSELSHSKRAAGVGQGRSYAFRRS
ncbi:hypothetical protein AB0M20_30905 [Actinoplanes sp. NPDC051633]|uniref:hypothetical protein n=1 Tax=Actinoplanes sp. NPDC051633 TaxID=3155670 RepID=UPI003412B42C